MAKAPPLALMTAPHMPLGQVLRFGPAIIRPATGRDLALRISHGLACTL